jgi:Spy/CpxP family protein refolding chaperone
MRTFGTMILAFGLVGLLVAPAQAQRPGGGRGFGMGGGGGGVALLTNKSVQQELKVDDAQAAKVNSFAEGLMEKQREQFQKLQDVPQDERRAKMQELGQAMNADLRKGLSDVLKADQVKRFEQIQLQQMGVLGAPAMPRVQEALNLTDDQKSKLRSIQEEQREAMGELFQGGGGGGDREAARQKMTDLRKKGNDKAMAVLTDSQKSTWKELTGAPFEIRMEPGQGGPGGPGGGRRQNNNNN